MELGLSDDLCVFITHIDIKTPAPWTFQNTNKKEDSSPHCVIRIELSNGLEHR